MQRQQPRRWVPVNPTILPADTKPTARKVLAAAVDALGGQTRDGQIQMAEAIVSAINQRTHLLVQAGTGTGKSLGYLVPALLHDERVVVATATLALQNQLVERDLPALVSAAKETLGRTPTYAVVKGRSNYACLHRVRAGVPNDQGTLVEVEEGSVGSEVLALRAWVEAETEVQARVGRSPGDRDAAPRHTDRGWRQVSVSHRECLGAAKCPFASECFAERARDRAQVAEVIVTNHSVLAIDAIEGVPLIPDYNVVVIDEAHELTARVTQASTAELSPTIVERAARRAATHVSGVEADDLEDAALALRKLLEGLPQGSLSPVAEHVASVIGTVRDAARSALSAFNKTGGADDSGVTQAKGWVQEIFVIAERMASGSAEDVLWLSDRTGGRGGAQLNVAPLQVWGPLRNRLLAEKTVIATSATLTLGGDFAAVAASVGLKPSERLKDNEEAAAPREDGVEPWRGVDVGSPFDYGSQAILYVAAHLPRPGRDALAPAVVAEIKDLVDAAEGRTLGLFSSRRAAQEAAEALRSELPHLTILAQGEAQLPELTKQFMADPHTCLFGTLGLWQGLDLPGETCQLVLIDRIPFPRPDDPLMSARQRAADRDGRNGFMTVAATHAALLLAQGAGRLIRTNTDRGVVAVLDSRLSGSSYSDFLLSSLPPMWRTQDRHVVISALKRLSAT